MIGTVVSLIVGGLLWIFPNLVLLDLAFLQWVSILAGFFILLLFGVTSLFSLAPMQKMEQNLAPRLFELFYRDIQLRLFWTWAVLFALGSLFIAAIGFKIGLVSPVAAAVIWIIAFGISVDLYVRYLFRIFDFLNPGRILELFTLRAKAAVQYEREVELCQYIDALAEVGMKSLHRSSTSLCHQAMDEIQQITKIYLRSEKSISHYDSEQVSFILFYIFQRLEMVDAKANELRIEPIASALVSAMGKISISAAGYDLSLMSYPLHFLGKFALAAMEQDLGDAGERASCVLVEVAREVVEKVDLTYAELQEPFFTLIGQLENIAKEIFRKDKSVSFRILTQPFDDLKALFRSEKMVAHQDTPIIIGDIDRVLDEFTQLETVMKTIPPRTVVTSE